MSATRRSFFATATGMALGLRFRPAAAQADVCPPGRVCVDYKDEFTLEIDPMQGYLQSVCVAVIVITNTTYLGTSTLQQVKMADFVSTGSSYTLREERIEPREGALAHADLGDIFVLTEAPDGN